MKLYENSDPDICMFLDILRNYNEREIQYMHMITYLQAQIRIYIQTRNGDENNISMRNVAEILHENIERFPDFIHKYIKTLARFVKSKREEG